MFCWFTPTLGTNTLKFPSAPSRANERLRAQQPLDGYDGAPSNGLFREWKKRVKQLEETGRESQKEMRRINEKNKGDIESNDIE